MEYKLLYIRKFDKLYYKNSQYLDLVERVIDCISERCEAALSLLFGRSFFTSVLAAGIRGASVRVTPLSNTDVKQYGVGARGQIKQGESVFLQNTMRRKR